MITASWTPVRGPRRCKDTRADPLTMTRSRFRPVTYSDSGAIRNSADFHTRATSTVFTLILIPVVFSLWVDLQEWAMPSRKFAGAGGEMAESLGEPRFGWESGDGENGAPADASADIPPADPLKESRP